MNKTYSLNPSLFFSSNDEKLNIISLEDKNNEVISLTKVNALIFPDIVDGKTQNEILEKVKALPDCPEEKEVEKYLSNFLVKLEELNVIVPK